MKTIIQRLGIVALACVLTIAFTNCEATKNANNTQKGAVIGAAGGAILGAIIGNKMDKQARKIEEEIPGAEVERVDDGIVITFDGENNGVYFDTNKYNINEASKVTLDKLAAILVEYPDTDVLVVGHTDSVGSDEYNMTLSKNRAMSVTNYFTGTKGLSAGRFTTNWFGETSPIATNDTPEGRAQNRRVNIVIVPNEKMKQDAKKEAGEN